MRHEAHASGQARGKLLEALHVFRLFRATRFQKPKSQNNSHAALKLLLLHAIQAHIVGDVTPAEIESVNVVQ